MRTPEERKHYAQGFLAALDGIEKDGMDPENVRLAGENMLVMAERDVEKEER